MVQTKINATTKASDNVPGQLSSPVAGTSALATKDSEAVMTSPALILATPVKKITSGENNKRLQSPKQPNPFDPSPVRKKEKHSTPDGRILGN